MAGIWVRHTCPIDSRSARQCESYSAGFADKLPTVNGRHVRCGARQSMPSRSIDSCAGLTVTLPSEAAGQTYLPFSRRLENMHAPWPSHHTILMRSPRRPRKTNRCPEYGSCFRTLSARAANPLNCLRMSVTPAASQTRVFDGTGITQSALQPKPKPQTMLSVLPPKSDGRLTT